MKLRLILCVTLSFAGVLNCSQMAEKKLADLLVGGDAIIVDGDLTVKGKIDIHSVQILTGAGAPSKSLAKHTGDIYINTTSSSVTTRIYIATAAGKWTNIVCAV